MAENVRDHGALGNGLADDSAAFQNADTAAQLTGTGVFVPTGAYLLSSNVVLNSAISVETGAQLRPAAAKTLTLNGPVTAPVSQVFGEAVK
jgi:polygalacturonase